MLKKFLGLDKKSGNFYLELQDKEADQNTNGKTVPVTEPVQETEPVVTAPTEQEAEPKQSAEPQEKRKTAKKKVKADSTAEKPETATPVVQQRKANATPDPEELIARAVGIPYQGVPTAVTSEPKAAKQEKVSETGFATNYLIGKPAPNRRPGTSLDKFREMTRTLKNK